MKIVFKTIWKFEKLKATRQALQSVTRFCHLVDPLTVFPGRRGQGKDPEVLVVLPDLVDDLNVGVVPGSAVRLVKDHQTDGVHGHHAAGYVVLQDLRRHEEELHRLPAETPLFRFHKTCRSFFRAMLGSSGEKSVTNCPEDRSKSTFKPKAKVLPFSSVID